MQAENGVAYCIWGAATAPWYFTAGPGDNGNDAPWDWTSNSQALKRGPGYKGIMRGITSAA